MGGHTAGLRLAARRRAQPVPVPVVLPAIEYGVWAGLESPPIPMSCRGIARSLADVGCIEQPLSDAGCPSFPERGWGWIGETVFLLLTPLRHLPLFLPSSRGPRAEMEAGREFYSAWGFMVNPNTQPRTQVRGRTCHCSPIPRFIPPGVCRLLVLQFFEQAEGTAPGPAALASAAADVYLPLSPLCSPPSSTIPARPCSAGPPSHALPFLPRVSFFKDGDAAGEILQPACAHMVRREQAVPSPLPSTAGAGDPSRTRGLLR